MNMSDRCATGSFRQWRKPGRKGLFALAVTVALAVAACSYPTTGVRAAAMLTLNGVIYTLDTAAKTASATGYDSASFPASGALSIPATVSAGGVDYEVTSLESSCFFDCTSLTSVGIPDSITSLPSNCFTGCQSLKSVDIPDGVSSLGGLCFAGCSSLSQIVFAGDAVTYCGGDVFSGGPKDRKYVFEKSRPAAVANTTAVTDENSWYYVTFLGADGSLIDRQLLVTGDTAIEPSAGKVPQKDAAGRPFAGWSSDVWKRPVSGTSVSVKAVYKASIAGATVAKIADQTETGKAVTPKPVVKFDGKTLVEGTDYTLSYKNNVKAGTATVTITGKGGYTGTTSATFKIVAKGSDGGDKAGGKLWKRLAGGSALTTMKAVVNEGWKSSEYAIVATSQGYHDALSASGLAGLLKAPVMLTPKDELSNVTRNLIKGKQVKKVIVVGGVDAVSDKVLSQIQELGVFVKRVAGGTAASTARAIYEEGFEHGGWGSDAMLATSKTYQDALSIAPFAYAKKAPVFLTDLNKTTAGTATLSLLNGFSRTIVAGGEKAVAESVGAQVPGVVRLAGGTAYGTCRAVAAFCLQNGMTAAHAGVATGRSYQDALCGAALCGKNNSIIVLADAKNSTNVGNVVKKNKAQLRSSCYVFGGTQAVSARVYASIEAVSK